MFRPIFLCALLIFASCSSPLEVKTIAGKEFFELNKVKLIERNRDVDNDTRIGVISDIHGNIIDAQNIADSFAKENVQYIFILGDSVLNEQLRNGEIRDDAQELSEVLNIFAADKVPVFIMPGNHEQRTSYNSVLHNAQKNVIDMLQYRILDLDDVALVAVPGYHDADFLPTDGYRYTQNDLSFIPTVASALITQPILLSHGPPLTIGEQSIDYVTGVGNVGDPQLNVLLRSINYSISGHIHEAGPRIVDQESKQRAFGIPLTQAWINTGAGVDGYALIIDINEGIISAKSIYVK